MAKNSQGRWEIKNTLLHDLLTYGDGAKRVTGLKACWSIGQGFPIVKGIVTWLTMRALKIERLPWMADWPFAYLHGDHEGLGQAIRYLEDHPIEVQDACDELFAIHAHTQSFYSGAHLHLGRGYKDDAVRSSRFGDFATTVKSHALAAQFIGQADIEIPQDVITSWARCWSYTGCVVGVMMDIPKIDVLCSAETLAPRAGEKGDHALESGEFLVLNRNWNGKAKVLATDVHSLKNFYVKAPQDEKEALLALSRNIPPMRPASNYRAKESELRAALQPFKFRRRQAWDILWAKKQ